MRRRLLLSLAVVLALVGGIGLALLTTRSLPSGTLETDVTDVTVVTPTTRPPVTTTPPPSPRSRCPSRTSTPAAGRCSAATPAARSRASRRPARPSQAASHSGREGSGEYIEYPPSYCDGVLYVNTFKGDTWAIDSETGKVIWKKVSNAPKPSTPAIAGDNLIVSSKDGTVTALTRAERQAPSGSCGRTRSSSRRPRVAEGVAYFGATDGRLFAVDVDTGHVRWAFDTGGRINSSPSLSRGPRLRHDLRRLDLLRASARRPQALEHLREARHVPLRELLRERLDGWRAALHDRALGEGRRAGRVVRPGALDGRRQLARLLDTGRRPRPDLRRRLQRRSSRVPEDRTAGSLARARRGADPRAAASSSATSSSSRRSRRRRTPPASRTGRSSGVPGSASTRRASRPSGRTTSRSTGCSSPSGRRGPSPSSDEPQRQ